MSSTLASDEDLVQRALRQVQGELIWQHSSQLSRSSSFPDLQRDAHSPLHSKRARKAQLARESRRRKKAYVQELERRASQLAARVAQLEAEQDPNWTRATCCFQEGTAGDLSTRSPTNTGLLQGHEPVQAACSWTEKACSAIEPGVQARFLLWALAHEPAFERLGPKLLGEVLQASPAVWQALPALRERVRRDTRSLRSLLVQAESLHEHCTQTTALLESALVGMAQVMSGPQMERFNAWAVENAVALTMIDSLEGTPGSVVCSSERMLTHG